MNFYTLCTILVLFANGCGTVALPASAPGALRFVMLQGEAALEPATLRVTMVDKTCGSSRYQVQALPSSWKSACLCLQSVDRLTQPRCLTLNCNSDFTANSTKNAAFTNLRPGEYIFQVTLMSEPNGAGESTAVHTVHLSLVGGSSTAIAVTMQTTVGEDAAHGGTVLNSTVSDTTGYVRSNGTSNNSVLASGSLPVIVAGDTLLVAPNLADSTAPSSASMTVGGVVTPLAIEPGVLSRVVLSYASTKVKPAGSNLVDGEIYLTDWVRNGNDVIRNVPWQNLANSTDEASWPAGSNHTRTGKSTFNGTYTWNTTTDMFPLAFADESALAENYLLVFRYYDNTTKHRLIAIKTLPMAVVAPASIGLTVN